MKEIALPIALKRWLCCAMLLASCSATPLFARPAPDLEEQERRIASELRCVVCQNLSIADSPSEMAQQMRAIILEQLQEGKSAEEIKTYFVSKYGEWVLLSPPQRGFSLVVWLLPFVALGGGLLIAVVFIRRWTVSKTSAPEAESRAEPIRQLHREAAERGDAGGESFRRALVAEQGRLRSAIEELEFDHQAGRLSTTDYEHLRRDLDLQSSALAVEVGFLTPQAFGSEASSKVITESPEKRIASDPKPRSGKWRLALGGAVVLLLGVTLGMLLSQSVRPRSSEQESMTGDFLTGTGASDLAPLLAQGRSAFERQEWGAAIGAFKAVLEVDPKQPEAHSYMGLILAQAGHVDEALAAFDRVLESDADFPIALWGKGVLLYQAKKDYAQARPLLERLAVLMPPGEERDAVRKILGEITVLADQAGRSSGGPPAQTAAPAIRGTISVKNEPGLKMSPSAVLFVIARSADSPGPPIAVKKIERPTFPFQYSLGPADSMIPGRPVQGKLFVSARLDQDGNPTTRGAGDWHGEYGKNPVEMGAAGVDITIVEEKRQPEE